MSKAGAGGGAPSEELANTLIQQMAAQGNPALQTKMNEMLQPNISETQVWGTP